MGKCKICGGKAVAIAPRTSLSASGPKEPGLYAFLCQRHLEVLHPALQAEARRL